jgi:uncharacterized protein (TIGR00251 family)
LYVKPHSKKSYIEQLDQESYEIAVTSKPIKGKANKEIIGVLAEFLNVKKSQIKIIRGHKSQKKVIEIEGV